MRGILLASPNCNCIVPYENAEFLRLKCNEAFSYNALHEMLPFILFFIPFILLFFILFSLLFILILVSLSFFCVHHCFFEN